MAILSIKGTRDGVSIILGEGAWPDLLQELSVRLKGTRFFRGAKVTLDAGEYVLEESDLRDLEKLLGQHDMGLYLVIAQDAQTRAAARALDVRAISNDAPPVAERTPAPPTTPIPTNGDGLLIHRTLRSGQAVQHPGHVVIIGDVNPGAEVIAGGDIIIWGRLRGVVHAGASGDNQAVVCALQLRPTQLRIGSHIARTPDDKKKRSSVPEMAFVSAEGIVAKSWDESSPIAER
jgi:septum site-determining protein MinC